MFSGNTYNKYGLERNLRGEARAQNHGVANSARVPNHDSIISWGGAKLIILY